MKTLFKTFFLSFLVVIIGSCSRPSNQADRLQGIWVQPNRTAPMIEIWSVDDHGVLTGKGGQIRNGDTCYHENLMIDHSANPPLYRALLPDREAVDFVLAETAENGWKWHCAANDFPRSISYEFVGNDLLQIVLSGDAPTITLLLRRQNKRP